MIMDELSQVNGQDFFWRFRKKPFSGFNRRMPDGRNKKTNGMSPAWGLSLSEGRFEELSA
jgi:hypothetical protein